MARRWSSRVVAAPRHERVHHHWRLRYRLAADNHETRPKRRGLDGLVARAPVAALRSPD